MSRTLGPAAACLLIAAAAAGCKSRRPAPSVTIRGHTWRVEIAATPAERHTGLSGRRHLAPDTGMLFVFPRGEPQSFCMRGCEIPLDIAFIGPDMRVLNTATMFVEADRAGRVPYGSKGAAQFVLEVNAGALKDAGVQAGDRVVFSDVPVEQLVR
jgi:hypothetical protein